MAAGRDKAGSCAIARLPFELLRQVFLELADREDRCSLKSCITVSKHWHEVALPVFMRHVVILNQRFFDDRFALFRSWLRTHKNMAMCIRTLEFTGNSYLSRSRMRMCAGGPSQLNMDSLKYALPYLPALAELRLIRAAILVPPPLSPNTPSRPIRALTLHADELMGRDMYNSSFGPSMFPALSAVLSLVAPDTLVLEGGHTFPSNPPESFPAPTNVKIRQLDLGKYWLDLPYWRGLLAPDTLEHFIAMWPWRDRDNDQAHKFHALMESVGTAVQSITLCMHSMHECLPHEG
ncbi:hypothetical protein L226DRAFT_83209 [Lentinus tigrinus ALCF2SS1-7]|nr:hypothetical protein L226DRAFT_83209 [Lentinus tigrinus ALCF2SS1-7]